MKKIILSFMFLMLLSLFGCGGKKSMIYLYNFKPESNDSFKEIAQNYKEKTGIEVKVTTAASGQYEASSRSEILKSNAPTIFFMNGYVGLSNWREYTYDLKDTKFYQALTENGKNMAIKENDAIYGVPINIEGYGLIYNKTIMQDYFSLDNKETDLKSLKEVSSFEEFETIVNDLKKYISGEKKTDKESIKNLSNVFATCLKNGSQWPYQSHLSNLPLFYEFSEKSDNTIAYGLETKTIEFKYFDQFMNMFDLYINNSVTPKANLNETDYDTAILQFASGKACFIQQGNWAYTNLVSASSSVVNAENIDMMPIFIGNNQENMYSIPVGTENYWCINKKCSRDQINASIDFINWLFTEEDGVKLVSKKLGFIAPFNSFNDISPDNPLSKKVLEYSQSELKTIPWTFQSYPSDTFKDLFGAALVDYTKGSRTKDDVKNIVIGKWKSEKS